MKCQHILIMAGLILGPTKTLASAQITFKQGILWANLDSVRLPAESRQKPLTGRTAADSYIQSSHKAGLIGYSEYDRDQLWQSKALGLGLGYFATSAISPALALSFQEQGLSVGATYLKEISSSLHLFFRGDIAFEKAIDGPLYLTVLPFFVWRYFPIYLGVGGLGLNFFSDPSTRTALSLAMNWQILGGVQILELFDCLILFAEIRWRKLLYVFDDDSQAYPDRSLSFLIGTSLIL